MKNKKRSDKLSMKDAIHEFIDENSLRSGLDKVEVKRIWKEVMGKGVSNYTTAVVLMDDVLHVELSSSVLREELSYGKAKIITMLNDQLDRPLIKKLVLR